MPFFIKSGLRNLKTNNPKLTFLRSIVGSIALICFFYGLSFTEIAKVQALIFLVPIFASILAIFFLKEIVGIRRWIAMGFAFCGALIILNPNVEVETSAEAKESTEPEMVTTEKSSNVEDDFDKLFNS